jgi:hypothetical protein
MFDKANVEFQSDPPTQGRIGENDKLYRHFIIDSAGYTTPVHRVHMSAYTPVPEIIDQVCAKTSSKRSFSITEYERFGLVFTKTRVYKFGHTATTCQPTHLLYTGSQMLACTPAVH